jgi:hypothetical protein
MLEDEILDPTGHDLKCLGDQVFSLLFCYIGLLPQSLPQMLELFDGFGVWLRGFSFLRQGLLLGVRFARSRSYKFN